MTLNNLNFSFVSNMFWSPKIYNNSQNMTSYGWILVNPQFKPDGHWKSDMCLFQTSEQKYPMKISLETLCTNLFPRKLITCTAFHVHSDFCWFTPYTGISLLFRKLTCISPKIRHLDAEKNVPFHHSGCTLYFYWWIMRSNKYNDLWNWWFVQFNLWFHLMKTATRKPLTI